MPDLLTKARCYKRRILCSLTTHIEHRILSRWFLESPIGGRVLDIGGGSLPYADCLLPHAQLINLDINRNVSVNVVADAQLLPFASGTLDVVVCTNVLEHLQQPQDCLAEISRVLRVGGELILVVPFLFRVHPNPEDHWRFTWQCVERLLGKRYDIVDQAVSGGRFAVVWEILGQIRMLEIIRIINPLLAKLPLSNRNYALSYCYRVRRRLCEL